MWNPDQTAGSILRCWNGGTTLPVLSEDHRPNTPEDGYAVQSLVAKRLNEPTIGWKIAATAEAGRKHINVDRPLAGRLYPSIVFSDNAEIPLACNRMRVAEAEIVLGLHSDLRPLERQRGELEVAAAVGVMYAGLEFPDSRFADYTEVGTACLIADNACAGYFVLGEPVSAPDDISQLTSMTTILKINDKPVTKGSGRDALGGPLTALTWLVNTVNGLGITVHAGEFVTTGVTGLPSAVNPGDNLEVVIGTTTRVRATAQAA